MGRGDLRFYGFVQFYPMIAIPVVCLLFPEYRYLSAAHRFGGSMVCAVEAAGALRPRSIRPSGSHRQRPYLEASGGGDSDVGRAAHAASPTVRRTRRLDNREYRDGITSFERGPPGLDFNCSSSACAPRAPDVGDRPDHECGRHQPTDYLARFDRRCQRKPWASSHPCSRRKSSCWLVSTPSATTRLPSAWLSSIIDLTMISSSRF